LRWGDYQYFQATLPGVIHNLKPLKAVIWHFNLACLMNVVDDDPEIPAVAALKVSVV
jgi:hypothetical protein